MPDASPGEEPLQPLGGWRATGNALAAFGWITFAICVALFLLWYVSGLKSYEVNGRVGIVVNPEAPQAQWRYQPAVNVEVFVRWDGARVVGLIASRGYCARTRIVRTNDDGFFHADSHWEAPGWPPPRMGWGSASPMVSGQVEQYFPPASYPPDGYTVILGPPPANSAMALVFTDRMSPTRLAEKDRCPPPR